MLCQHVDVCSLSGSNSERHGNPKDCSFDGFHIASLDTQTITLCARAQNTWRYAIRLSDLRDVAKRRCAGRMVEYIQLDRLHEKRERWVETEQWDSAEAEHA